MIDQATRDRIQAAIAKAEQGTRAEFVAAVARRADDYRGNAIMAGFVAAILAGVVVWIFAPWPGPGETLVAELIAFIIVFAVAASTRIGMAFVPAAQKRHAASKLARLVFLERGLASTEERCGVLFFIAQAECHVEIIADHGIDRAVEPGAWQKIVDGFTAAAKQGQVEQGFVGAIDALGALLARHYPPQGENPNRIPDRLVEL
jgi:putative membrane protein